MPDPKNFEEIITKLLKKKQYRNDVCANPRDTIGAAVWDPLSPDQKAAIMEIACRYLATTLDNVLEGTGDTSSKYICDR